MGAVANLFRSFRRIETLLTRRNWPRYLPALVLLSSLAASWQLWRHAEQNAWLERKAEFDLRVHGASDRISRRMQEYEQILYAMRGFFATRHAVGRGDYAAYADSQELTRRLPGLQSIGYAPLVAAAERRAFVAALRRDGAADYDVRSAGTGDWLAPVAYIEPDTPGNQRVLGFDNLSNPERRAALERARDTGQAAISRRLTLLQDGSDRSQAGYLLFLPVYKPGAPHATAAERGAAITGWLCAAFRINDAMAGLFAADAEELEIQLFDAEHPSSEAPIYDTAPRAAAGSARASSFAAFKPIDIGGRTWLMAVRSLPAFEAGVDQSRARLMALSAVLLGLLLAWIAAFLVRDRSRALRLAEGASSELRRNKAFQALLEDNERRWKLALEAVGEGVWDWDLITGRMTYSRHFEEMLGYAAGELEREHEAVIDRIHPDDRQRSRDELLACLRGESAGYASERRVRCKDGSWKWVLARGMAMDRGPDGRYRRMIGTHTDISERRAMEQALDDARQISDDIINALPGNFYMFGADGHLIKWNKTSERVLGYSPAELARLRPEDFFAPEDFPPVHETIRQVFESGEGEVEALLLLKNGDRIPYHFRARRTSIQGRHYMVGVGMDISARRAAEAAVRENDERYRAIFSSAQDFIFTIDTRQRITSVTDYFCDAMGYTMAEVRGAPVDRFFTAESMELIRKMIRLKMENRATVTRYEADLITREGRVIPVEINSALIFRNGELQGSQGIARDITERRNYEEALRESERRWKLALEAAGHGVWDWNMAADAVSYSALSMQILGCAHDDCPRCMADWQAIVHPDDLPQVRDALNAHVEGRAGFFNTECRIITPTREWKWIASRAMVVERTPEGVPLRMLGTLTDISEQKRTETALRLSEAKLQAIVDHAPVGIWLFGADGRHQFFNKTFCDSIGVTEQELLRADSLDAILGAAAAEACRQSDREALAREVSYLSQEKLIFADGKPHHLEVRKVKLHDPLGGTLGVLGISVDVTEQREREAALRESEERYRGAFDDGNYFVFTLDVENRITYVPRALAQLLGYTVDELQGMPVSRILSPRGLEISYAHLQEKQRGEASVTLYETEVQRADGTILPIEVTTGLIYRDGRVAGVRGVGRDISERRNYEKALLESEEKYRSLFESAGDFAYSTDLEGNFTAVSELLLKVTGYERDELCSIQQILSPDQLALAREMTAAKMSGAKSNTRYELEIRTRTGQPIPLEIVSTLVYRGGRPVGVQGIGRDMAERKRAEERLRRSERNYRELMEQAAEAIFVADPEGRCYVDVNQAACDLLGFSREELIGREFAGLLHSDDIAEEPLRQALTSPGKIIHTRARFRRKEGRYVPVELSARVLSDGRLQALGRDVSRWLERESALQETNLRAQAASRAKSEFLANMSHEIRTPMNSVIGMARLALARETEPRQTAYLEKILISGEHLLGIIDDILDFSKIEAGKLRIEEATFEPRAVLDSMSHLMADKAIAKGLEFSVEVDPALPHKLRGDPLRLRQVLLNFVDNAIKFTARGSVKVQAKREYDGGPGCGVFFEVSDTGIGLSQVEMSMLFRPFQQSDGSVTRKYGGTGLGLSISKRLVELMGGEAGLESAPGQGSRFWFRVKLNEAAQEGREMSEQFIDRRDVQAAIRNARILLAENNAFNQQVAREFLEIAGCLVQVANDGYEVLDLLQKDHFDCVLMDVQMPLLDGIEATRQIRANQAFAAIPVIAVTANALEEERQRCLEAGMNDFITKPLRPEALYAVLAKWLARQMLPLSFPERRKRAGEDLPRKAALDVAVLSELVGGHPGRMRELAHKFLETAREDMDKVQYALEQRDLRTLREMGHHIKAPAAMVGAAGLAGLCQQLEANQDGPDRARELVNKMQVTLAEIEEEIRAQFA